MIFIRGAITIKNNTIEEIKKNSILLFSEIINRNNLKLDSIKAILFSCTSDITKEYPGKIIREHYNLSSAAIMHFNEMNVENSLKLCIRILLIANDENKTCAEYVYLNDAKKLREDLFK
ncbi:chorismate mutase AroH [Clostridium tepidiprofundi DSM 19306]|uniref:chorismate mutase n=1 Tax=Clostridium tepidiprofundi DSM 19306 TaxID=1121338 RepID=A0A151B779_9CLOT|nr:chorismate mutase [Clostridium tepidiprofundi]KYH35744.1 chorismate mutase AroH [Clostridium tepidiprofundi DSM 19306]